MCKRSVEEKAGEDLVCKMLIDYTMSACSCRQAVEEGTTPMEVGPQHCDLVSTRTINTTPRFKETTKEEQKKRERRRKHREANDLCFK